MVIIMAGTAFSSGCPEGKEKGVSAMERDKLDPSVADPVRMVTVFDNHPSGEGLETGWGFGCVVRTKDMTMLFDTGADGGVLLDNMAKLEISPSQVDAVVLSHPHFDHVGGLAAFLEENNDVTVYGHTGFGKGFQSRVESRGAKYIEVSSTRTVSENAGVTGPVGSGLLEQAFFVSASKGLVVITGCAHPGVVRMVERSKEATGDDVYLVLGGFHLGGASQGNLASTARELRDLGVRKAAPCHCSGDKSRQVFSRIFGEDYVENGVGKVIEIP